MVRCSPYLHLNLLAQYVEPSPCVHCARCVDACPMKLELTEIVQAVKRQNWKKQNGSPAMLASNVDPAPCLPCPHSSVQYIRMGKQFIREKAMAVTTRSINWINNYAKGLDIDYGTY